MDLAFIDVENTTDLGFAIINDIISWFKSRTVRESRRPTKTKDELLMSHTQQRKHMAHRRRLAGQLNTVLEKK